MIRFVTHRLLAAIGVTGLGIYFGLVFVYTETRFGTVIGLRRFMLLVVVGWAVWYWLAHWLDSRGIVSSAGFVKIFAASMVVLLSFLFVDVSYAVFANVRHPSDPNIGIGYDLKGDPQLWYGELYPRSFYPSDRNFVRYKPNVSVRAESYGEFYRSAMRHSPTLVDSVLQLRPISYSIDQHGFRDTNSLHSARVFALGDSFVFGYAIADGSIWIDHLENLIERPIYNLGVSATGPGVQLALLKDLLAAQRDSIEIEHLLWMVFEGNDLENDLADQRPAPPSEVGGAGWLVQGTVFEPLLQIPKLIRDQSVLYKLRSGQLILARPTDRSSARSHDEIDGIPLMFPLYHSQRWGYRLFNPQDVERATRPRTYVLNHLNRTGLEETFGAMRELSDDVGFRVTVVIAPSAARVYGSYFEDFPTISATPYFIDFLQDLSDRNSFDVVNLLPLLSSLADQELLYYRDDHHWNERGNEVVAQYLSAEVSF